MAQWLKIIYSSSKGPAFSSQHPRGGSQSPVTLILGDLMPPSDFHGH